MWPNPIQYFQNHGIEIGENGMDSDEDEEDLDESVVVVGEDDDDDDEDDEDEDGMYFALPGVVQGLEILESP
jgi:hypothetical protein